VHPGDLRACAGPAAGRALVRRRFVARTTADALSRDGSAPTSTQRTPAYTAGIRWRHAGLAGFHLKPPRSSSGPPKPRVNVLAAALLAARLTRESSERKIAPMIGSALVSLWRTKKVGALVFVPSWSAWSIPHL
jgi:hypothetical protein